MRVLKNKIVARFYRTRQCRSNKPREINILEAISKLRILAKR
jgi:hypothetical protein